MPKKNSSKFNGVSRQAYIKKFISDYTSVLVLETLSLSEQFGQYYLQLLKQPWVSWFS